MTRITNQGSRDYKTGQLLGITNWSRFRDYKTGQKDCKLEQGLQNGAKRLQIGAGITNCISIWIFCTQFICLAFDGLLQSIFFRMFCSKHSITLGKTYLISYRFHCVDIFYIKFRVCETFIVTNLKQITLKLFLTLYLHKYHVPRTFNQSNCKYFAF